MLKHSTKLCINDIFLKKSQHRAQKLLDLMILRLKIVHFPRTTN